MTAPAVYKAISDVQAALAKEGISKSRRNQQQGFAFRGIDDVYSAIAGLLPVHGLTIIPRMIARDCTERPTRNGGAMLYVTVEAEFDFVAVADGSKQTARTFGEASDSGDKATNKAMSAAMKYAVLMTFTVPTEGDNDADAHTPPEPAPRAAPAPVDREAAARDWKNSQIAKLDKWKKEGKFDNIHAWPDAPNTAAFLATLKQDFPAIYESVMTFWRETSNPQTPISAG